MARFSQSGGGNPDVNLIKTKRWGYPTQDSVAIIPSQAGEAIALKSSGGAQLRWHIRDTGRSVVDYQVNITSVANMNYANYNGLTYVTFNIATQDIPLPTGGYYYQVYTNTGNGDFNGTYQASDSSINTITLIYDGDITAWDTTDFTANLNIPSVYSQVQTDDQGVWIKNDNWTQEPYENVWWHFQRDGGLVFPDGSTQYVAYQNNNTFEDVTVNGILYFKDYNDNTDPMFATKDDVASNVSVLKFTVGDDGGANVNSSYPTDGSNIYADGFAIATTNSGVHHYMNVAGDYYLAGKVIPTNGIQFSDGSIQTKAVNVVAAPTTATDSGIAGQIAYDSDYIYICISANTWKRTALSTW